MTSKQQERRARTYAAEYYNNTYKEYESGNARTRAAAEYNNNH